MKRYKPLIFDAGRLAKFDTEADCEVHLAVARQKTYQTHQHQKVYLRKYTYVRNIPERSIARALRYTPNECILSDLGDQIVLDEQ